MRPASRSELEDAGFQRLPLALGSAGAVLVTLLGSLSPAAWSAGALLLAGGWWAGRRLSRRHAQACDAAGRASARHGEQLAGLCGASAPVWTRQIETARGEADHAVAELTRLFGQIAGRLDAVMGPVSGTAGSDGDIMAALAQAGADLADLVAALHGLQEGRQRMVAGIGHEAARLKESAAEIRQIALHTRMVALNATIEAARAGEAGRAFAVVVGDMRELASRTAAASEQFSRNTDGLHGMVTAAFEGAQSGGAAASVAWAEDLARRVIERFEVTAAQLTRAIEKMERERRDVREDVTRVLISLQFQDRASQILAHVVRNLQELQQHLAQGSGALDAREWLQGMSAAYSTDEEFGNLDLPPGQAAARPPEPAHAGITYF